MNRETDKTTPAHMDRLQEHHRVPVIDILNYYIEHSYAAYFESAVGYEFYDRILAVSQKYPAVAVTAKGNRVVGFAFLNPYHEAPSFNKTAVFTCFLHPDWTGRGIGRDVLCHVLHEASVRGIESLMVHISSLNAVSVRFHERNGFVHRGTFKKIGTKFGKSFDVLWMQRLTDDSLSVKQR